jgi:DNA-binding response OmpR family regulator
VSDRPLIAVCDDELPIRELVKAALGDDYRFAEAANAEECAEILRSEEPALLVLDVMLPGRSGLDLLQDLRRRAATARLPVVVISAWPGDYEPTALNGGADAFFGKPFDPSEFADTVGSLVAR